MKIRRPDAAKAARQLERQHMAAADRAARVARQPRFSPAAFVAPVRAAADFEAGMKTLRAAAVAPVPSLEAWAALGRAHQESQVRMVKNLAALAKDLGVS